MTPAYLATYTALLVGLVLVDQTAPRQEAPAWKRLAWLGAELALCYLVVWVHGTLIRPALIYLLPASRALVLFGERPGLALSLTAWLAYAANIAGYAWPDKLNEYPNYLSFFLAPYALAVVLTLATLRQSEDRRRLQRLYDELRLAHVQLQALHRQAQELAVTQERNRLAREIHDTLAHYLTVINVQLELAEKLGSLHAGRRAEKLGSLAESPIPEGSRGDGASHRAEKLGAEQMERALEQVRRARRLTVECLQETRRSVAALRAASLDELSLPKALEKLATEFAEGTGIAVQVEVQLDGDGRLAAQTALALYRAAQEGLTNVYRHAQASRARLRLAKNEGGVELVVEDDGVGPSENGGAEHGGFGLLGLRERVELLGGQVVFGAAESGGGRLLVALPTAEDMDEGTRGRANAARSEGGAGMPSSGTHPSTDGRRPAAVGEEPTR